MNVTLYYAHNIFKLVNAGKLTEEKNGMDGMKIAVELLKSRTNKSGKVTHLLLDQENGFDPILSMLLFADNNKLLDGRNPNKYFIAEPSVKFNSKDGYTFKKEFLEREEVRLAMMKTCMPLLKDNLSYKKANGGDDDNEHVMKDGDYISLINNLG